MPADAQTGGQSRDAVNPSTRRGGPDRTSEFVRTVGPVRSCAAAARPPRRPTRRKVSDNAGGNPGAPGKPTPASNCGIASGWGDYNPGVTTPTHPPELWPPPAPPSPLAVLVSGGLDSAVLLAEAARTRPAVFPLYVRTGIAWEAVERLHLDRFLAAVRTPALRPLVVLEQPVADLYGDHWSLTGVGVPAAGTPDEDVFLPGRNVLLLAKPLLWCHLHGVSEIALAPLAVNPFPDATPEFFDQFAGAVNRSVGGSVNVIRPYSGLHKTEVIRRGARFPLEHTFSCIRPAGELHCGRCSKCHERRVAFAEAGIPDPTEYAAG